MERNIKTLTMKTTITTILILLSINIFAQKEINLSNKDLTEFIYNDTMKDVTYLDLSVNLLHKEYKRRFKELYFIN